MQARSRATVDAIVTACSHILVERGYEHLTTTRAAEVAGVSIGSLYQYFPGKDALIAALLERNLANLTRHLQAAVDGTRGAPLADKLRALAGALVSAKLDNPPLSVALATQLPRIDTDRAIADVAVRAQDMVRSLLEQHSSELRTRDLDMAAFVVVHAVDGVVREAVITGNERLGDPALVDELTELMLGYLTGC